LLFDLIEQILICPRLYGNAIKSLSWMLLESIPWQIETKEAMLRSTLKCATGLLSSTWLLHPLCRIMKVVN